MLAWTWSVPATVVSLYVHFAWPLASVVFVLVPVSRHVIAPASGPESIVNDTVAPGAGAPAAVVAVAVTVVKMPSGFDTAPREREALSAPRTPWARGSARPSR